MNISLKTIDDVCKELELESEDKLPRIVGVPMTWSYYAVSGGASIVSATILTSG